jgi:hypothetical protein
VTVAAIATTMPMFVMAVSGRASAETRIRVKGSARIVAHSAPASGKLAISGGLTDDAGQSIGGAALSVGVTRTGDGTPSVDLTSAAPESCGGGPDRIGFDGAGRLIVTPDASGRFCLRLSLPKDSYIAHLEVRSSKTVAGTRLDLPINPQRKAVSLRFDPEPSILLLDDDTTALDVVGSIEEDGATDSAPGLRIFLTNESDSPLAQASTDASGHAHLVVRSARLGAPGRGELRITAPAVADAGASAVSIPVERRTHVVLSAPDSASGRASPAPPDEGVIWRVVATTRCVAAGCSGSPSGTVEARVGDTLVGAATLDHGEARLVLTFSAGGALEQPVRLTYLADAPWFVSDGELVIIQPFRAASVWKRAPLALAGIGVIAWLALVRLPGRKSEQTVRSKASAPGQGARIEVVHSATTSRGWRGETFDADDQRPLEGTRVWIERRGFKGVEVLAHASSDAQGRFVLEPVEIQEGDTISAEGRLHQLVRGPLPPRGELRIALVFRKRAIVDKLVAWARRQGRPFDARPDPTPGHVRRAAGEKFALARWADAVERAAYGAAIVDEQAHAEVERLSPGESEQPPDEPPRAPGAPKAK